jgi:hypothetical protein
MRHPDEPPVIGPCDAAFLGSLHRYPTIRGKRRCNVEWEKAAGRKLKRGHVLHHLCRNHGCCVLGHLLEVNKATHYTWHGYERRGYQNRKDHPYRGVGKLKKARARWEAQ